MGSGRESIDGKPSVSEATPLVPSQRITKLSAMQMFQLGGVTALTTASSDAYIPVVPMIRHEFGATLIEISLALQLNWVISGFSGPLWGSASTLFGRKLTLAVGLVVFECGTALAGLAPNCAIFIMARCIQGLGEGAARAIAESIVCDVYVDEEPRNRALATISQWFSVTIVAAPAFGGGVGDMLGWRAVFFFLFAWGLIQLVCLFAFLPETVRGTRVQTTPLSKHDKDVRKLIASGEISILASTKSFLERVWESASSKQNANVVLGGLIFNFSSNCFAGTLLTLWPYTLEDRFGLNSGIAGLIVGSIGIAGFIGAQLNKTAVARFPASKLLAAGVAVYFSMAASLLGLAITCFFRTDFIVCSNIYISTVIMLSLGVVIFFNYPSLLTTMLSGVAPEAAATVVGLNSGIMFLGLAVSSLIGCVADQEIFDAPTGSPKVLYTLLACWGMFTSFVYVVGILPSTIRQFGAATLPEPSRV